MVFEGRHLISNSIYKLLSFPSSYCLVSEQHSYTQQIPTASEKMRFIFSLLPFLALATSVVHAQNAYIYTPADMTEVSAGSSFNVTIAQGVSILPFLL